MDNFEGNLEEELNLRFPMITVSVSHDDVNEPIHVDLGSIQPFIAIAVLEKVIEMLKVVAPGPKIMFNGAVIAAPVPAGDVIDFAEFLNAFESDDEGGDSQSPTSDEDGD